MQNPPHRIGRPGAESIRILHLISSRGFYGAERVIWNLTCRMDRRKVTAYFAIFDNRRHPNRDLARQLLEGGFPVRLVPCRGRIDAAAVGKVARILRDDRIDILHCHEDKGIAYGIAAAKLRRVASVVTLHSWLFASRLERIYEPLIGILIRFFDRIAVVSNAFEHDLTRYRINPRRVHYIPNGVEPPCPSLRPAEKRDLKERYGAAAEDRVVAMIGRLEPGKGHREFLLAAALLARDHINLFFLVAGDGSLASDLKRYADCLGLSDKVAFTGFVEDMSRLYGIIDISVLPSSKEGMPMVILEAMGHGIGVVATRVGELKQIIRSRENGILLNEPNATSIQASVDELLRNPELLKHIGISARQTVHSGYLSAAMARRYELFYADVIASRPASRKSAMP